MQIVCKICGTVVEHEKEAYCIAGFLRHLRKKHNNMSKEEYLVAYELGGIHPTCACGCGKEVKPTKGWNKWRKYYGDHKNTVPVSQEIIELQKLRAKEKRESGYFDKAYSEQTINDSFLDFKKGMSLNDIVKKYNHDKRTLKRIWIDRKMITEREYLDLAYSQFQIQSEKQRLLKN